MSLITAATTDRDRRAENAASTVRRRSSRSSAGRSRHRHRAAARCGWSPDRTAGPPQWCSQRKSFGIWLMSACSWCAWRASRRWTYRTALRFRYSFEDGLWLFARSVLTGVEEVRPGDRLQSGVALRATESEVWLHPYDLRSASAARSETGRDSPSRPRVLSLANSAGCACHENSTVFGEPDRRAKSVLKKTTDSRDSR